MKSECKKIVDSILKNTQYNPINKTGFEYDVTNMFFHPCELKRGEVELMGIIDFLERLASQLWGTPFLVCTIAVGVYYLIATKAFSFIHLGHIFKNTFGTLTKKNPRKRLLDMFLRGKRFALLSVAAWVLVMSVVWRQQLLWAALVHCSGSGRGLSLA